MSQLDPTTTTAGDLATAALRVSLAIGQGQAASGQDLALAQSRMQWMLQQWERKRWLVPVLVTLGLTSTGALAYTVGPSGDFDTGVGSVRPAKLESAFLRQIQNTQPNQIDYPLEILQSREDYNNIALKSLQSFPQYIFLETNWPLASVYAWPVPQASIYAVYISIMEQLPQAFATAAALVTLPYEYYSAVVYNLGLRLRPEYGIPNPPGDNLMGMAKDSLATIRNANFQVPRLQMPPDILRNGIYNIFSDRFY